MKSQCVALFLSIASAAHSESVGVDFARLSSQETEPFQHVGMIAAPDTPIWDRYRPAIEAYPRVQSCLIESEQAAETPNLLKFDWATPDSKELEVCLFRIGASLGSQERIVQWMELQEFRMQSRIETPHWYFDETGRWVRHPDPVTRIGGGWSPDIYREKRRGSLLHTLFGLNFFYSFTIQFVILPNGDLVDVSATVNSL